MLDPLRTFSTYITSFPVRAHAVRLHDVLPEHSIGILFDHGLAEFYSAPYHAWRKSRTPGVDIENGENTGGADVEDKESTELISAALTHWAVSEISRIYP